VDVNNLVSSSQQISGSLCNLNFQDFPGLKSKFQDFSRGMRTLDKGLDRQAEAKHAIHPRVLTKLEQLLSVRLVSEDLQPHATRKLTMVIYL